jgi:hypothetical protein
MPPRRAPANAVGARRRCLGFSGRWRCQPQIMTLGKAGRLWSPGRSELGMTPPELPSRQLDTSRLSKASRNDWTAALARSGNGKPGSTCDRTGLHHCSKPSPDSPDPASPRHAAPRHAVPAKPSHAQPHPVRPRLPCLPSQAQPGRAPPGPAQPCLPCLAEPRLARPGRAKPCLPCHAQPSRA